MIGPPWASIWMPVPAAWPACESGTGTFLWSIEIVDEHGKRGFQCEETDELPPSVRAVVDATTAVLAARQP